MEKKGKKEKGRYVDPCEVDVKFQSLKCLMFLEFQYNVIHYNKLYIESM